MAEVDTSALLSTVSNTGSVRLFGMDYTVSPLSKEELTIFASEFDTYFGNKMYLHGLHTRHRVMAILTALRIAKSAIGAGNMVFKGIKASPSELGWQWIRPGHIMRTTGTTETASNVWDFDFTVTGTTTAHKVWIGYGTSFASKVNIDKNCLILMLGLASFSPMATIDEIHVEHGNVTYNPEVVKYGLQLADSDGRVPLTPVHTRIFGPTNQVRVYTRNDRTIADHQISVFGITFGEGNFLSTDYYSTIAT